MDRSVGDDMDALLSGLTCRISEACCMDCTAQKERATVEIHKTSDMNIH